MDEMLELEIEEFGDFTAEQAVNRRRWRHKLWEVTPQYLCSVIGTCLSVSTIRKQALRDNLCSPEISDYDLHGLIVVVCKSRSETSRKLHKHLERRFSGAVRRASNAKTPDALRAFWKDALDAGRVAESYWAVMTHPAADYAFITEAFGDVHMLSHVLGASRRSELRQLDLARATAKETKARLRALDGMLRSERTHREALEGRCAARDLALERQEKTMQSWAAAGEELKRLRSEAQAHEAALTTERQGRESAEREARRLQCEVETRMSQLRVLREERSALVLEAETADAELTRVLSPGVQEERTFDLQGATILYVGGRTSLVRHYRIAVRQRGGVFVHHDGGLEECTKRLDKQVRSADVVLCPMDAVSHDASQRVKVACRRFGRTFVPMRSAGIVSLCLALGDLRCIGCPGHVSVPDVT